jgi:hypothetical protein
MMTPVCSYGIDVPVGYRLRAGGRVVEIGEGRVMDISGDGIRLQARRLLTPAMEIELLIAWPARLNSAADLTLRVCGRTAGIQEGCTAVSIRSWMVEPTLAD